MNLEVNVEEHELIRDLVQSRIGELHPEIRRSMQYDYKEKLSRELECCEALLERLKTPVGDVS